MGPSGVHAFSASQPEHASSDSAPKPPQEKLDVMASSDSKPDDDPLSKLILPGSPEYEKEMATEAKQVVWDKKFGGSAFPENFFRDSLGPAKNPSTKERD